MDLVNLVTSTKSRLLPQFFSGVNVLDDFYKEVHHLCQLKLVPKLTVDRMFSNMFFCNERLCIRKSIFQSEEELDMNVFSKYHDYHTSKSSMDSIQTRCVNFHALCHEMPLSSRSIEVFKIRSNSKNSSTVQDGPLQEEVTFSVLASKESF